MDEIVRNLEDGPDLAPDWRHLVVQQYLVEVGADTAPAARLRQVLDRERDPFVRQYVRFRFNGKSANSAGFRYAVGCQERNQQTGAASMIRAMLVADRTPEEIARELGTHVQNIITFAKTYWDVRRYLGHEPWLRRIVFGDPPQEMGEAEALREKRWLAAAFHRGWEGVEQVVFHRASSKPADVEALTLKLQSTLASRALEYALELETSGKQPTEADLNRFLAMRNVQARQQQAPPDHEDRATTFIRAFHGMLEKKAEANPDDPGMAAILEMKRNRAAGELTDPIRRRTRFSGS